MISIAQVDALSKQYNVDVFQMGKVRKCFDEFDVDGSGEIDQEEFKGILAFFLGVTDINDMPPKRLERFWQQIDIDQSGSVTFPEFVEWLSLMFPDYLAGKGTSSAAAALYRTQATSMAEGVQEETKTPSSKKQTDKRKTVF